MRFIQFSLRIKAGILFCFLLLLSLVSSAQPTELFFSEYVEGSSSNKYLEIFNGTGAAINLSDYQVILYSNGAASPTTTTALSGTLNNGEVIVIKNASAAIYMGTAVTIAAVNFNGDDAVALFKISTAANVDVIGQIGTDPGVAWTGSGVSTFDKTLRRKPSICSGDTNGANAFDPSIEWVQFDTDVVSGLGSHALTVPTFTQLGPYNVGDIPGILPVTSINGVTGTWNPLTISTAAPGTTSYVFTPTSGGCVKYTMDVTVNDAVTLPSLSITNVSQLEGNAGQTSYVFTVILTLPAGPGGVTFDIATADNTATLANNDYASNSALGVIIPEGVSFYEFVVDVNGDTDFESMETFYVNITNVTGAIVTRDQGIGTIQNDDFITPTFTPLGPYCVGDIPEGLPGTSENSITGSWDPATISTASAGTITYTFTPDPGQNAIEVTMMVEVNPKPQLTLTASAILSAANCGDMVIVEIAVSNTFENINSLQYRVTWNPSELEYSGNSFLPIGGGIPIFGDGDVANGNFGYSWIDIDGFDGEDLADGTVILSLLFKVRASNGTASVGVDINNVLTPAEVGNSSFCVATPSAESNVSIALSNATTLTGLGVVCLGSSITLTGSGTPAEVDPYTSSDTELATVSATGEVTGIAEGTVTITYTNDNGCTATKEVTINPCDCEAPPFVNFTPLNTTVCVGGTVTIGYTVLNGPATINTTGFLGTFSDNVVLNDGTGTFTYTPAQVEVGTTLTIFGSIGDPDEEGPCSGDTASASIAVNPVLEPTFAAFGPYCQGEIPLALPSISNNGVSGNWSPSSISTATPGTTTYLFFLNENEECADSASIKVVVTTPVIVEAGTPQTICGNQTLDLSDIGASISGGTTSGTWSSSGTGSFTGGTVFGSATAYVPSQADKTAGTVTLTLTSADPAGACPAKVDTVVITIKNLNCGTFPWNGGNN